MKKNIKTCTALLLLLILTTVSIPGLPFPQPDDGQPGISVLSDDDNENIDDLINCY